MSRRRRRRREPIKAALSLLPSCMLTWFWWGWLTYLDKGPAALPGSLLFIILYHFAAFAIWWALTDPEGEL